MYNDTRLLGHATHYRESCYLRILKGARNQPGSGGAYYFHIHNDVPYTAKLSSGKTFTVFQPIAKVFPYPSSLCDTIIDFTHEYGFTQTVDLATRDNNIFDVFFTNRPCLIRRCYPIAGISDHEAVFIESFITLNLQPSEPRKFFIWQTYVIYQEPINTVQSAFFSKFSLSTPINTLWEEFKSICFDCLSLVPAKLSNTAAKQPWITTHIKRLSRHLYNLARASNCPIKWKTYRNFKKEVQHKCREAYHRYITSLID